MPQFQGPIFLETWDLSQISRPNLKKQKCYLNNRIDWEHILEKKKYISCHDTVKGFMYLAGVVLWISSGGNGLVLDKAEIVGQCQIFVTKIIYTK